MANYGIRVSKNGANATSNSIKDFVIDSEAEILKTIQSGTVNLTISGASGTVNVYHGLGYYPTFTAYYADGSEFFIDTGNAFSDNYDRVSTGVVIGCSTDTIKLKIKGRGTDGTYSIYYEIFENGGYK